MDYLVQVAAKVLEQYHRGVSTGWAGDRATWMRGGAGLVETGNRHTVLRVAWYRSQGFRLGQSHVSTVATPMPVVAVDALQVEGAANLSGEDFVTSQVGRVLAQFCQIACCHLFLDLIPMLGSLTQ